MAPLSALMTCPFYVVARSWKLHGDGQIVSDPVPPTLAQSKLPQNLEISHRWLGAKVLVGRVVLSASPVFLGSTAYQIGFLLRSLVSAAARSKRWSSAGRAFGIRFRRASA